MSDASVSNTETRSLADLEEAAKRKSASPMPVPVANVCCLCRNKRAPNELTALQTGDRVCTTCVNKIKTGLAAPAPPPVAEPREEVRPLLPKTPEPLHRTAHAAPKAPKRYPVKADKRVHAVSLKPRSRSLPAKMATADLVVHVLVIAEALLRANEQQTRVINMLSERIENVLPAHNGDKKSSIKRVKSFALDDESSALIRRLVAENVSSEEKKKKEKKEKEESDDNDRSFDLSESDSVSGDADGGVEDELIIDDEFLNNEPASANEPSEDTSSPFVRTMRSKKLKEKPANPAPKPGAKPNSNALATKLSAAFDTW